MLTVVGTRPEAIKLAPVVAELRRHSDLLSADLCATAQHREMLDQVLDVFGLHPDHDLDVMKEDQSLTATTAALVERVSAVLRSTRPDLVLVVGDTTTGFATSLASFYERIPVGHIEAGLRTARRYSPFPEEMLRRLITQLATIHFAPTQHALENLHADELLPDSEVHLTGNPVVDAIRWVIEHRTERTPSYHSEASRMILVTAHRRENFGEPILRICEAIRQLVERNSDIEIVYPVHPNPNVTQTVHRLLGKVHRIHLLPPQDYVQFVHLMADSYMILTDSGGIQEEAPVLGKPVLVMRDETERPDAIEAGTALLVGSVESTIVNTTERLLRDAAFYGAMAHAQSPFGDGHSAERIVEIILQRLNRSSATTEEAQGAYLE